MRDWLDYVNLCVQLLLLAGLVWYTVETRRIRRTSQRQIALSQDQVEATLRPCVSLSKTSRSFEDVVLALNDTDSAVVVLCPEGVVQIENIGVGPAINIRYDFRPADHHESTHANPKGYVAGISQDGNFRIPVARGLLQGHLYECVFDYESVSHRRYRTRVRLDNLVITEMRFDVIPTEKE
jgi:hypothetical protein